MTTITLDNRVKQIVSNIRNLPTPPIVFNQIQKVINDPNVSANNVANILAEDPAMSVKVLKLTNSAFYGLKREIEVVKEAVVIVGMEAVKNLVLSASVMGMFKADDGEQQEFQEHFWRHSLATAVCARLLARKFRAHGVVDADAAFSAGLLHDVGKMVIACYLTDENAKVKEYQAENPYDSDTEAEMAALGYNHAQIGGFLAEQWKLPQKLRNAITYHHSPLDADADEEGSLMAFYISVGNHISKLTFSDRAEDAPPLAIDPEILSRIGMDKGEIGANCEHLREDFLKAETFMKMAGM